MVAVTFENETSNESARFRLSDQRVSQIVEEIEVISNRHSPVSLLEIREHLSRFIMFVFALEQDNVLTYNAAQKVMVISRNLFIVNGFLSFVEAVLCDAEVSFRICIVP